MDSTRALLGGVIVVLVLASPSGAWVAPPLDGWDLGVVDAVGVDPVTGAKWFSGSSEDANVFRFDELEWLVYAVPDLVSTLTVDRWGRIWLGGANWGVFHLEDGEFKSIPSPDGLATPAFDMVTAIGFSSPEDMWIGCYYHTALLEWYVLREGWRTGQACEWVGELPEEWGAIVQLDTAPDGSLWFATSFGVGVVRPPGESEPQPEWHRTTTYPALNTDMAICPGGGLWLTVFPACEGDPDIFYSVNGVDWDPVDHPNPPGRTGKAWSVAAADEEVWFSVFDGPWYWTGNPGSGGALWHDGERWRWLDIGSTRIEDIAVDEATSDVWFATTDGAYVLRGGPDAWPPVWIELTAQETESEAGKAPSRVTVEADVWFQMDLKLDVYVAVQDPVGNLYFAPAFGPTMAPMAAGLDVPIGLTLEDFTVLTLALSDIPEGTYRWYAGCTNAGTTGFASNIASCEWNFFK